MAYNNGRTLSVQYDNRMRPTQWNIPGVMGWNYSYQYFNENSGRLMYAQNINDGTLDRSYDYDHVGRLLASHSGGEARAHMGIGPNGVVDGPYAQRYYYDVWGNITSREGWGGDNANFTATYTNNKRNGLTYGPAGHLLFDGGHTMTYDATGQQASAGFPGYLLEQFYDGDGLRVKKNDAGNVRLYLRSSVLGGQVIAEMSSTGAWQRGYVYLGSELLAIQQSGVYWVHQDPLVKSKRITNSSGNVVSTLELDPWGGNTNRNINDVFQPHRFTNYERDLNAADEAMFRRYNRWWSRFDQPDPSDGSYNSTNPQSFNRYPYTNNDPVNFVDPSGLDPDIDIGIFSAGDIVAEPGTVGTFGFGGEVGIALRPLGRLEPVEPQDPLPQAQPSPHPTPVPLSKSDQENQEAWERCVKIAIGDQLGIKDLLVAAGLLPVPKSQVGFKVAMGASETTNVTSTVGQKLFRGAKLPFKLFGTKRIFGMAGRASPWVAAAMAGYDIYRIAEKVSWCNSSYNVHQAMEFVHP